jgi:hypothetical protein
MVRLHPFPPLAFAFGGHGGRLLGRLLGGLFGGLLGGHGGWLFLLQVSLIMSAMTAVSICGSICGWKDTFKNEEGDPNQNKKGREIQQKRPCATSWHTHIHNVLTIAWLLLVAARMLCCHSTATTIKTPSTKASIATNF